MGPETQHAATPAKESTHDFRPVAPPSVCPFSRTTALLLGGVVVLTFLVYAGTLNFQFVYDDRAMVLDNPAIQSWHNLPQLFGQHLWSGQSGTNATYYRPIFMTWFVLDHWLFGFGPMGWHASVLLLHLISTALVFLLARRLLVDDVAATIAALVFGLHPVHVEGVAWVTGADNPLMAALCLGAFLCWLRFRDGGARRYLWLAASLLQYGCACLTKEPGITLVGLVFCYEWLTASGESFRTRLSRATMRSLPFLAVALLYLAQRRAVLRGFAHAMVNLPAHLVPLSWPKVLTMYARLLVWPAGLSPLYDTHYTVTLDVREFWLPLASLCAIALLLWFVIRRLPSPGGPSLRAMAWFSLAWIVLPLLPLLDLLALEPREMVHDRYLYLPSVGLCLLAAIALRRVRWGNAKLFGQPLAQALIVVLLAVSFSSATVRQSSYWANDLLLFDRAATISPRSPAALNNLANALLEHKYYDEGIAVHERLVQLDPNFWQSHYNLAHAYDQIGRDPDAERELAQAARLNPAPHIFVYLAVVEMKMNQPAAAEQNLRAALRIAPPSAGEYELLGLALEQQGRWSNAVEAYERELAVHPNQPKVRAELDAARAHLAR